MSNEFYSPYDNEQQHNTNLLERRCFARSEEIERPAVFIDESPDFEPEQGIEFMTYVVYVGSDCFDCITEWNGQEIEEFVRFDDLDSAYDYGIGLSKKLHIDFEGKI